MTIFVGGDQTLTGDERVKIDLITYRGDTNKPIVFSNISQATELNPIVDVAIALTKNGVEVGRIDVTGGDITINAFDQFTVTRYAWDLAGYQYKYDIQIILDDGTKFTPIYGFWTITEDQTKP